MDQTGFNRSARVEIYTLKYKQLKFLFIIFIILIMSYPPIYSSPLLNELHALFPELLYRPERFQTVQDVLQYIIRIANENPYYRGLQEYNQNVFNARTRTPILSPVHYGIREIMEQQQMQRRERRQQQQPQQQQQVAQSSSSNPSISVSLENASNFSSEQLLTSFFSGLLNLPASSFRLHPSSAGRQRDDSEMRIPTSEQILANTDNFLAIANVDDNCAICQDPMLEQQRLRMIYVCGHVFHTACLDRAFTMSGRCPNCRHDITE
jgi:hypothetical protein